MRGTIGDATGATGGAGRAGEVVWHAAVTHDRVANSTTIALTLRLLRGMHGCRRSSHVGCTIDPLDSQGLCLENQTR